MPSKSPSKAHRRQRSRQQTLNNQPPNVAPLSPCCAQLHHENKLLRRALRAEREKRTFATSAYRQLLQQFGQLVDLRTVMVEGGSDAMSSSSLSSIVSAISSSSTRTETTLTEEPPRSVIVIEEHEEALLLSGNGRDEEVLAEKQQPLTTQRPQPRRQDSTGERGRRAVQHDDECEHQRDGTASAEWDKENVSECRRANNAKDTAGQQRAKQRQQQKPRKKTSGESQKPRRKSGASTASSSSSTVSTESAAIRQREGAERPNWYFVPLKRGGSSENNEDKHQRVTRMFERSQQRCDAIRDVSCVRAQIAAGRRAVAADLLTGRRALDTEALNVLLYTDSSRVVHAFPPEFMREQRHASRRHYEKSPIRMQQERDRQRHFEGAINRILAHSSATVAKMIETRNHRAASPIQHRRNSFM